jgi:hypothetical protein
MIGYASQYEDFTILDGTFCVSMYELVLMMFHNVDSLFKTTIIGIVIAQAERSDVAIRSSRRFLLAEKTILMTDLLEWTPGSSATSSIEDVIPGSLRSTQAHKAAKEFVIVLAEPRLEADQAQPAQVSHLCSEDRRH